MGKDLSLIQGLWNERKQNVQMLVLEYYQHPNICNINKMIFKETG